MYMATRATTTMTRCVVVVNATLGFLLDVDLIRLDLEVLDGLGGVDGRTAGPVRSDRPGTEDEFGKRLTFAPSGV